MWGIPGPAMTTSPCVLSPLPPPFPEGCRAGCRVIYPILDRSSEHFKLLTRSGSRDIDARSLGARVSAGQPCPTLHSATERGRRNTSSRIRGRTCRPLFLYTRLRKKIESTLLFLFGTISIKSQLSLKNLQKTVSFFMNNTLYPWNETTRKKINSIVTNGIFHLIILIKGLGCKMGQSFSILVNTVVSQRSSTPLK